MEKRERDFLEYERLGKNKAMAGESSSGGGLKEWQMR